MTSFYGNGGGGAASGGSGVSPNNIAEEYNSIETYNKDDIIYYNGKLYQAISQTTGDFDSTKWTQVNIIELIQPILSLASAEGVTF